MIQEITHPRVSDAAVQIPLVGDWAADAKNQGVIAFKFIHQNADSIGADPFGKKVDGYVCISTLKSSNFFSYT